MAHRKRPEFRKYPYTLGLSTVDQNYIDAKAREAGRSRGDIVSSWIREDRKKEAVKTNLRFEEKSPEELNSPATLMDLQNTLDAHGEAFLDVLKHESQNGGNIERLIIPFAGLVEKKMGKKVDFAKVRSFFTSKMEELSVTNF